MPSFIDFRKEYLEENPGSSMTVIRNAYYKSVGKTKPKKTSRKKTSRKKQSRKKQSRKKQSKKKQSRKKQSRKKQSGGASIFEIVKLLSDNMASNVKNVYELPKNDMSRSIMIDIANMVQDLSQNVNKVKKINENVELNDYKTILTLVKNKLDSELKEIDKLTASTAKLGSQTNDSIIKTEFYNNEDIKTIKSQIEQTVDNSKQLADKTNDVSRILYLLKQEI